MSYEEDNHKERDTIPPPGGDPDKAWRVAVMKEMTEVTKEVKELRREVKALHEIATKCFEQMLKDKAEIRELRTEVDILKARITLAPNAPTAPEAA